jgi:hypothetical protein
MRTAPAIFGKRNKQSDNVLMVLWGFRMSPEERDRGTGILQEPPSDGAMTSGGISWEVVS